MKNQHSPITTSRGFVSTGSLFSVRQSMTLACRSKMVLPLMVTLLGFLVLQYQAAAQACNQVEDFTAPITIGPSQAPGIWYVDRYAPNGFFSPSLDLGGPTLKHSINVADGAVNRAPAFQGAFYNTQGRKYDLPAMTRTMQIDLYVPSAWATSNKREAGLWGTAVDIANAVSGYPILEFTSDGGNPRFRCYETGSGTWFDLGLPAGFVYNAWYTLEVELLNNSEFLYTLGNLQYTTTTGSGDASVAIANVVLQGYNYDPTFPLDPTNPGVTYDIYWDNYITNLYPVRNTTLGFDYCTLQAAINAASPGDNIELLGNLFEGLVTINKALSIDGNGFTLTSTSPTYGINPDATGISIQDLTLQDAGTYGIQTACGADFLLMTNVTVNSSGNTGISIYGSDNCTLNNITSTNNGGNGVNITNCDNTTITGITTSGNTFGSFEAGIGLFTSGTYCLPAGLNGFTLGGTISIAEATKVYSQKANAADPITGVSGATIDWAVGIGALDRSYWPDKLTAYAVVDALFEPPYNFPNTAVYVADVVTEHFYVDDDPNGDATPPMLVQTAVTYETPGKTIFLESGTFNERVILNKSLTLDGSGMGASVLDGTGLAGNGNGITLNTGITNVTIRDLTVRDYTGTNPNSSAGIYGIGGNNNLTVTDVDLADNIGGSGFYANGPINNVLLNNVDAHGHTNVNGAARGIVIWNGLKSNITITNCEVYNNNCCGIELQDGSASGVTMTGNDIHDNGDNGIGIVGLQGPGVNSISANTLLNNGRFGIEIKNPNGSGANSGAGSVVVSNNSVTRNVAIGDLRDISGIAVFRRGVLSGNVDVPNGVVVTNNTVTGYTQPSNSEGFGIVIEGTNHTATGNTITGNDVGLQQQAGHTPYPGDGDQSNLADTYFGRGNSPMTCGNIVAPNTFSSNGTNTRNVGVGAGLVINTNTSENFCSIQAAINDANTLNGHTISVAAGTFVENIVISKELNITGAGQGITIIQPAISDPNCGGAGGGSLCGGSSNVMLVQASNVTISNLTIDGNNPGLSGGYLSNGIDVDARNGIITNHVMGVYNNLVVNNVEVKNIYLRGIYASSGGTFTFSNNTVTNVAAEGGSIAMFNFGGSGAFTNNSVSLANDGIASNHSKGTTYTGNMVTLSASGIHTDNNGSSGGVADIIQNNTVTNSTINGYGIWVFAPYLNVQVLDNTVTNVDVGLTNAGQQANVTPSFLRNTVDGMNKANSTGVYHTTSLFSFGTTNVSGIYSNNFIRNNTDAFYLEYQAGRTNTITTNNNSITDNDNGVILVPTGGTLIENFQCNWWGSPASGFVDMAAASSSNYTSWLVDGTDASGDPGFQPVAMACSGTDVVITSAVATDATCNTTGTIQVTFSGGTGPYDIAWTGGGPSTGVTSPYVITGLSAGSYTITVTDDYGSTATATATVLLMGVENTTTPGFYYTIQAAIDAANNNDVIEVCAATYTENITINKPLTINGPNQGTPGTGVRAAEALLSNCNIDITAAGTVILDGFKIYQTDNNTDVILISGGTIATIQNNILERNGVAAGQVVRAITTSSGAGAKLIQNNLITGDLSGGLFSGHKTWNSGMYINGAASNVSILNNTIQNSRTALNLDDFNNGIVISGNILNNCGTMMSFGGVSPTNGQYVLGSNNFTNPASTLMNLSNVNPAFRLDITSSMLNGALFNTLSLPNLFTVEGGMYHRGRSGRNGLVYYVANKQYVVAGLTTIQSAVDYAASGDVINVNIGTYNEEVTVDLPVTIDGATGVCGDVIIEGGSVRLFGVRVLAGIQNVTLKDFKVQNTVGANAGIWAATNNNGLNLQNLCLENTAGVGAILASGPVNGITINACEVWGSGVNGRGIVIWDGFKQNITITGNNVHDIGGCCGIELQDGSASGVTMTGNTVTNVGDSGMSAVGLDGTTGNNTISNNIITNTGRFGLEIKNPNGNGSNIVVNANTITLSSLNPGEERDLAGIAVFRRALTGMNVDVPKGVVVSNNIVTGYAQTNGASTSEGFGIVIEGINHSVNGNTLTGNDVGLQQQAGHLPYPGDGDQSDLNDTYFGRGNSPMTCGNTIGLNTYASNGTDTRNIGVGGGIVYNSGSMETFCTIQSAIDDANTITGHTLTIADGTYNENVTINKELTLTGGGSGSNPATNTVLTPATSCTGTGLTISAANVTIQNMYVTNYLDAVLVNGVVNPSVINMSLVDYCRHGISFGGSLSSSVYIYQTNIQRTSYLVNTVGIRVGTASGVDDLLIDACTITGNIQGSFIGQATTPSVFNNITIQNSTISNNLQKGLYFEKLNNALLKNLTMDNNGTDPTYGFNNGIDINLKYSNYSSINIEDCDITNSGANGTATDPQNAAAIAIKARDDSPSYNSIPATLTSVTLTNNRISGPQNGVRFGEFGKINNTPTNVLMEGNELSFAFAHKGVIRRTNDDLNLLCNWHGTTSLPAILATLAEAGSGSTLLSNILNSGGDGNLAVGFQPTGTCVCPSGNLVTNTNTPETFCSIQAAIDDPDTQAGDVLVVGPGTYIENVIVDKSITILGPNSTIDPCSATPRNPEAIIVPAISAISSGEVFHVAADNVTISGFTIDGNNTALTSGFLGTNGADIDAAEGITVYETGINDLTVTNNIIQNLSYFGVTLYDYPAGVPSSGHTIANNKIQDLGTYDPGSGIDFWGGGVLLYNNQYAAVTDNCMQNVRLGVQTGNFSLANPGSSTYQVISGNTMSVRKRGIFHNLAYGTASGFTLSDNSITGVVDANETSWDGILLSSLSVPSTASNNTINGTGITVPSEGYEVWNVKSTSPVSISGGSVNATTIGLSLNNYEGYNSNAPDGAHATVNNLTITPIAIGTGIRVHDNPSSSNANVQLTIGTGVSVSGGATGLRVENPSASIAGGILGNLSFTGTTGQYIDLVSNAGDLDATSVSFDGQTGITATIPQLFTIENKINHEIDNNALGFVTVKASNAYVTDINASQSAINNDYTRIRNAVELAGNNWSINLNGTFDWNEANAATSWSLGNDGLLSPSDDYSILVPANLNGLTFTAPLGLGTASIAGPGDLAAANLEGVLVFDGGDNQGWTISNMTFTDFDLGIGMFNGAGGSDAYNNTTITNNIFNIATDLNAVDAPADVNQNIGLHYSFGANQTISNNTFNVAGDGASNGVNFSSTVCMQSNTSGGNVYDGLLITGNTTNILNAQSANPQVVLGIWENGHAHNSNITVSNNQFNNLAGGNNPVLNLQRAFRVTSHSGAGSTVTYSGNTVQGANIGFQWISGSNFSAQMPVAMTNNALNGNSIAMLIQSNGKALLTTNDFDAAIDNSRDVQIQPGSVVTTGGGNQWAGEEYYVENLSTNSLNITGEIFDQANNFRRTDRIYGALQNPATGLVRFDGNHLYVSTPGTGLSDETIQNAISAVAISGDLINIESGTYSTGLDASAKEITVIPGASPGCVTLGSDMVLTNGDQLNLELNSTVACTGYDRFIVNGTVTLGGANLNITLGYIPSNLDKYTVIVNDLADPVSGTFSQGSSIVVGPYTFVINYAGGDGNDVVLEMCTGITTITTPTLVVENTPMLPASVPDAGAGATYVWSITNGTITGGQGTSSINYTSGGAGTLTIYVTVTDDNGCVSTDDQVVNVITTGPSSFAWVPDNAGHGTCPAVTNCCTDVICYGLEYTPGVSGNLTTYTTGFKTECLGNMPLGVTPIVSNQSCIMSDNSFELNACSTIDSILFNSSGNGGMVPVLAGVPIITHKVCFKLEAGVSLGIVEDVITNLSASVDLTGGGQYTEFPTYTSPTILSKPLPVIPAPGMQIVSCPSQAVLPTPPTVLDYCGNPVPATLLTTVDAPDPVICEGTRTYSYNYTDCAGETYPWSFTYTIDDNINPTASNPLPINVECYSDIPAFDITVVTDEADNCGGTPVVSYIGDAPPSVVCDGATVMVTRTYRVTDCAGNFTDVFQTINVDDVTPPSANTPTPISVECFSDIPAPNPSVVTGEVDNCDGTPGVAFISDDITSAVCDGATVTVTRKYRVTDCSGNTFDVFQTINVDDVTNPTASNPPTTAVQCFSDIPLPDVSVVTDEADNCDGAPIVTHIGDDINSVTCDGATISVIRTYQVADCSGNFIQVTQTFNVNDITPPAEVGGPVPTGSTIGCPLDAVAPHLPGAPAMPVIEDFCGNVLTPSVPVQGGTWVNGCTGTITFTYTYTSCSGLLFNWVYTYTVDCDPLTLKVLLEGPYIPGTGTMNNDLHDNHLLPGQDKLLSPSLAIQLGAPFTPFGQPYNAAPWNYNGNTGLNFGDPSSPGAPMGVIPYDLDVVDWILVTVRKNGLLPANNHWTCAGWVHQDGEVTFPESCGTLSLNGADNYYVMVQHRNHLGILSPAPALEPCSGYVINWDFTAGNSYQPTFRYGQKMVDTGIWAMHAANGEQITSISAISSPDRTTWRLLQGVLGYSVGDYNMSTVVTPPDETVWKTNQNKTSGVIFY